MGFFSDDSEDWRSEAKTFDDDMSLEDREKAVTAAKVKKLKKKPVAKKKVVVKPSGLSASESILDHFEKTGDDGSLAAKMRKKGKNAVQASY